MKALSVAEMRTGRISNETAISETVSNKMKAITR